MILKNYQEEAVADLIKHSVNLLNETGNKTLVFRAPTGSGKTIMMAEFLARLTDVQKKSPLSFIWVAPRKLHEQSYDSLERYYEDSNALVCRYFNDLSNEEIDENEILFFNWESIRQVNKNVFVRENEQNKYLGKVLENTKAMGREVVLLIDESHFHADATTSRKLIKDIAPKLTVEISATPVIQNPDNLVPVPLEKVKEEGMIKSSVIINDAVGNSMNSNGRIITFSESSDELLLKRALDKRQELAAAYKDTNVNPLLCIQLPDRRSEQDDVTRERVENFLYKNDIKIKNGKLAVWLSGEHENRENIALNDSETEALIFKQAISLGWDCPRAQILVLFRDWKNVTFSVQTLGRIMRMPEQHYYDNDILNKAYVYTNLSEAEILEDMAGGYIHTTKANRIDEYSAMELKSVHRIRQREQTRLSPRFSELFLEEAEKYDLKNRVELKNQTVQKRFIENYEMSGIDASAGETITGQVRVNLKNKVDLQKLFDYFVRDNLTPYYPEQRSINRVKMAIYDFFRESLNMDFAEKFEEIITITLSEDNNKHFVAVINETKKKYKQETEQRKTGLLTTSDWEVPETTTYGESHAQDETIEKSVMMAFYASKTQSGPEQKFIQYLEKSTKVKWWYKNGESDSLYFAVPYTNKKEDYPFFVDFIVYFNDGTIGLYDTKGGFTIDAAGNKSDGLLKYIRDENKTRKQKKLPLLIGGIVTQASTGNWEIYTGEGKNIGDSPDWESLDFN